MQPEAGTRRRRDLLKGWLTLGAGAALLTACGRSSQVRYPDGRRYRDGDIPNSEANVPSSRGSSTF